MKLGIPQQRDTSLRGPYRRTTALVYQPPIQIRKEVDEYTHTNIKTSKFINETGINIATRQCTSRSSTVNIYRCIPSHVIHAIVSTQSRLPLPGHNTTGQSTYSSNISSRRLNHLVTLRHQLCDLLVLVLQNAQRKRDIVPLSLRLTSVETRRKLLG